MIPPTKDQIKIKRNVNSLHLQFYIMFSGIGIGWVAVVVKLQSLVALLIASKMSAIILSASVSMFKGYFTVCVFFYAMPSFAFAVEITDNKEFWKVAIDKV
ncbi:hypothetical protein BpHYR1_019345 [Brachionus plicatilis]|uniref:Uncharacterized protein n=1 Tax=Brachionus plicatilis TaxID=10195 RepID=A0A3M7Q6E3_BRAPC|nr:hypothetical protein BpHYR1_019345 [Brachionus plicatilis]